MEGASAVIRSVCIISAAICLTDSIASGTRFRNQIRFLLNLVFIAVIIAPIVKGSFELELPDIEKYMTAEYYDSDEEYMQELEMRTEENISSVLMQQVQAAGINCSKIETDVNISDADSISISRVTVSADDFEAAADVIKSSLGAETEVYNGNS